MPPLLPETDRPWLTARGRSVSIPAAFALLLLLIVPLGTLSNPSTGPAGGPPDPPGAAAPVPTGGHADLAPSAVGSASPVATVDLRALPPTPPTGSAHPLPHLPTPRAFLPTASNPRALPSHLRPALQLVGAGFEGLNDSQCGCAPPDVIDAAGPTQVVEMVNLWMEVWTKQGAPLKSVSAPTFFASGTDFLSDPRVLYDNESGRWFASIFDAGPATTGLVRFAVSSTSDAAGLWTIYATVTSPSGEFPDQPILGVSDHLIAFGANMFSETTGSFFGSEYWVVDKAAVLNGSPASQQSWGPDPNYLSIHPVQSLGPSSTQYFVSSTSISSSTIALWAVTGVPPSASRSQSNLTVAGFATAPAGRAPGGGLVDTADTRVQGALGQGGNLWIVFDDQCTPIGDTGPRACVRTTEIAASTSRVLQEFDYGISGLDVFYPAIALDAAGDLTMVFGYSSTSVDPSGGVSGRAATDPSGAMGAYRTIVAGSASLNCGGPCRYGDYFGAGADPTNDLVWVAAEYLTPAHNWDSWIAPVVTVGPASARLGSAPAEADAGSAVTIQLTGENVTCSSFLGLYCTASVPLGDGSVVTASCGAGPPVFSWTHIFAFAGIATVGLGGYLSEFTTPTCAPGTEVANLSLSPYSLRVSAAPALRLTASPANGADVGQSISLSAAVAGGRTPFTFRWSGLPVGCLPSLGSTVNCTATTPGGWLIQVNATDANGVGRAQTLAFTVSPALTTSIASTTTVLDIGQEVTLVATPDGGSGSYGFLWTGLPSGCEGTNVSNLACVPTSSGTFLVQQATADTNGVSVLSPTISLTVQDALHVALVLPANAAPGQSEVLVARVSGGGAPYSFAWSGLPAGCTTANSSQLTCTPQTSGSWSIHVGVVDDVGALANATAAWPVSSANGGLSASLTVLVGLAAVAVVVVVAIAWVATRRRSRPPPRARP